MQDNRVKLVKPDTATKEEDASFYNASWIGTDFIAAAMPQVSGHMTCENEREREREREKSYVCMFV